MNALANPEVGKYLNENFVSSFQKVATFKIVGGQKQGGNVASYFCAPDGRVLHVVAGPVDAAGAPARGQVGGRDHAISRTWTAKDAADLKAFFRKAHADRLLREDGVASHVAPRPEFTTEDVAAVLGRGRGLDNAGRIHLLLSTYPLAPIGKVYRPIFERVLNEAVSTSPVLEGAAAANAGRAPARVLEPAAADRQELRFEDAVLQARNDPAAATVQSGQTLNVLLTDLRRLDDKGVALAEVGLDEAVLGRVHVVASGHGDDGPALVLQDPLPWPASLGADDFAGDRTRLEAALQVARAEAAEGPVARDACQAVIDAANRLDQRVTAKIRGKQGWPASDAIEAATFVTRLKASAAVLRQPDVSGYLSGAYAAKGKTVLELVRSMASKGLRFAPALPGDEPAYRAVQRALANCDARTHAAAE